MYFAHNGAVIIVACLFEKCNDLGFQLIFDRLL